MKPPIYEPAGKAKEYGDLAINIYTGCTHGCYYCFAPNVLHKTKEAFSTNVMPRAGIVEEVKKQLDKEQITGKLIHLCFTCDPYPALVDTTATREIIKLLKESGNHIQILTKSGERAERDFDLLDSQDWFGVTWCGYPDGTMFEQQEWEPFAATEADRLRSLSRAYNKYIKTWISIEPVLNEVAVLNFLELNVRYIDKYKIGKLNYYPSVINWGKFGNRVERICKANNLDYYIKDSLRKEMKEETGARIVEILGGEK